MHLSVEVQVKTGEGFSGEEGTLPAKVTQKEEEEEDGKLTPVFRLPPSSPLVKRRQVKIPPWIVTKKDRSFQKHYCFFFGKVLLVLTWFSVLLFGNIGEFQFRPPFPPSAWGEEEDERRLRRRRKSDSFIPPLTFFWFGAWRERDKMGPPPLLLLQGRERLFWGGRGGVGDILSESYPPSFSLPFLEGKEEGETLWHLTHGMKK